MKREKITIPKDDLMPLLGKGYYNKEYRCEDLKIDSCDEEDGGGWYTVILKRLSDNKYFQLNYCDWDNKNDEMPEKLEEVFPRQVTITIFE